MKSKDPLIQYFFLFLMLSGAGFGMIAVLQYGDQITTGIKNSFTAVKADNEVLRNQVDSLSLSFEDALYQQQIQEGEKKALEEAKQTIETEYARLISEEPQATIVVIDEIYAQYQEILKNIERNKSVNISIDSVQSQIPDWGLKFLNKEYSEVKTNLTDTNRTLNTDYQKYLASLPTPTPRPTAAPTTPPSNPNPPATGYSYQSVSTIRGNFGVYLIKLPLSQYMVKTVTANTENCTNNCPAKPLATYISENSAYAGMHGTYFCPPDYASCAGKSYSYDFAVYNSNLGIWLSQSSLAWNDIGLATFNNTSPSFYALSQNYSGGVISAGIANFPSLTSGGQMIVDDSKLTAYQRDIKGTRGAVGTDGTNVYLAVVASANMTDTAYVMLALGATDSLNLDGGGSSAMYIAGSYKLGPGRLLPNAIVLVPR